MLMLVLRRVLRPRGGADGLLARPDPDSPLGTAMPAAGFASASVVDWVEAFGGPAHHRPPLAAQATENVAERNLFRRTTQMKGVPATVTKGLGEDPRDTAPTAPPPPAQADLVSPPSATRAERASYVCPRTKEETRAVRRTIPGSACAPGPHAPTCSSRPALSRYVRGASVSYPSAPSLWGSPFSSVLVASCDTTSTCSVHASGDVHPHVGFASPPPRWMEPRPFGPVPPDTTGRPPGLSEGMRW